MRTIQWIIRGLRHRIRRAFWAFPKRVQCNVCGWQGRRFLDDPHWHKRTICPQCRSQVRHRLLIAALSQIEPLSFDTIFRGKRVLHFAPEPQIARFIGSIAGEYITADFLDAHADLQLDISHMKSIDNARYDVVIACDVLEHVVEHKRALDEIGRVLSPQGISILTVPQPDDLETTFEDPTVVSSEERERRFGQADHVRLYGRDFPQLVEAAGFQVTIIDETNFSNEQVQRNVLFPPEMLSNPLATNYRKVFFARK